MKGRREASKRMEESEIKVSEASAPNTTQIEAEVAEKEMVNNAARQPKGGKVFKAIAAVLLCACFTACIVLTVITLSISNSNAKKLDEIKNQAAGGSNEKIEELATKMDELNEQITKLMELANGYEDIAQEDDVTIGGEYVIRSTKHISDAYIAGDTSGLTEDEQKLIKLAEDVFEKTIKDDMTDYEKELALYEWIRANIKHDDGITVAIPTTGQYADNPLGVLSTHKAVCVGYATTFRFLLQMQGIECMVVHDTSRVHSWDIVKLNDNWYITDIYMDAESTSYTNFNMNDQMAMSGHEWNTDFFPAAEGIEFNYAVKTSKDFKSVEAYAKDLHSIIDKGESATLSVRVNGDRAQATAELLINMIASAETYVYNSELTNECSTEYECVYIDENDVVVIFRFINYSEGSDDPYDPENGPTEEELQNAMDIIDKLFEDFYDHHEMVEPDEDGDDEWDDGEWKFDDNMSGNKHWPHAKG